MIFKELDPFQSDDKFARSGRAAEEKMAFYLKRFFGNDPDILVLNGIRIEADGDAAQIDHLVIHSHGLSIVESKSVHGKIQIKDDGQWIRWFGANQSKGMASPITQARLQERFFRDVLGKASKNEAFFSKFPIDLYVAISDDGIIIWPQSGPVSGVCKADQVADKIIESNQEKSAKKGLELTLDNRKKIAAFLKAINKPLTKTAPEPEVVEPQIAQAINPFPEPVADTATVHTCKHCGGKNLEIRYSYSYFFYCNDCERNTAIKAACPTCGGAAKLRKQKKEFFAECEKDAYSGLFFVNP
ncbi:Nuclease-related domain-containing protein [Formivibrio citricus]|uniref:Nuclease-related domain-containing protein n=1 Tax=Formivibrio citricus TaxID=83765 RepID=A0A1I4Z3V7_9NEIS|nr:nuclease-related domain-containing protein [Formivibrio citricus]SFN44560.1 Nuclease-related domain-containing protein [Formivibrio citricus]